MSRGFKGVDEEMQRIAVYESCAEHFGFVPSQVDEIDAFTLQGMLMFLSYKNQYESEQIKRASKGR
jgi:hypothetical protein